MVRVSVRNFYGFKFWLLTKKSRFPCSLIPLVIETPHFLFPLFPSFAPTRRQDQQDGFWIATNSTRQTKKTTGVHHRTLASYRCLSIAKGFDVLLCYDSPSRFPLKSNSSGSTSMIGVAAGSPSKSSSILAHRKFLKQAILITSTPAAASVYAYIVILACDIPGLARGNANAWHIAWGKSGGKTSANLAVSMRFWRNATWLTDGWGKV